MLLASSVQSPVMLLNSLAYTVPHASVSTFFILVNTMEARKACLPHIHPHTTALASLRDLLPKATKLLLLMPVLKSDRQNQKKKIPEYIDFNPLHGSGFPKFWRQQVSWPGGLLGALLPLEYGEHWFQRYLYPCSEWFLHLNAHVILSWLHAHFEPPVPDQ